MFNVGDLVCLKSGSPGMTVSHIDTHEITACWYEGGKFNFERFAPDMLAKQD